MSKNYLGKDLVHYGSGILLDPETAYEGLDYSARKNLRRAEKAGFVIKRCSGSRDELNQLRSLWYFPDDPNFPVELAAKEILYLAYLGDELAGGMVLMPVGSHLFLNNLTASERGKREQLQGFLLWYAVNDLANSSYRYIDIGVSYRVNLQRFFTKWATFRYPVILNPPVLKPVIGFHPFRQLPDVSTTTVDAELLERFCLGRPVTVLPSVEYARNVAAALDQQWRQVEYPCLDSNLLVVDMTRIFPSQFGALLIGIQVAPEELWERFGCYDYFKTRYLTACMAIPEWGVERIRESRLENYRCYRNYFENEDVDVLPADDWISGFKLEIKAADSLEGRYASFGVETERTGTSLTLPCHQGLSARDIEYVYAIYRGYLNLCSEWQSTGVKGAIKLTGS